MQYNFVVPQEFDSKRLLVFLRSHCSLSLSLVRSIKRIENGLLVEGRRAKTDQILRTGQRVEINLPDIENRLAHCTAPVPIIYESAAAIVFDKPAGMATHPTLGLPDGTLANVYATLVAERGAGDIFRPVNRLDKNTSGLVLAAKDRYAAPLLAKSVRKEYIAVCEGEILASAGVIDAPIARAADSIICRTVDARGAPSQTEYRVLKKLDGYTVLQIATRTGRTHQIRVHMTHIGHPLAGDTLYGGQDVAIARHALHCFRMCFADPAGGGLAEIERALPTDMLALAGALPPLSQLPWL